MLNYIIAALVLILSFTTKPYTPVVTPSAEIVNVETQTEIFIKDKTAVSRDEHSQPLAQSGEQKYESPKTQNNTISSSSLPKNEPKPVEEKSIAEDKVIVIPTITPTPFAVPTIHIVRPPNDEVLQQPTPTSKNPCYCEPSPNNYCIDLYSC